MGPTLNLKKTNKNKTKGMRVTDRETERQRDYFYLFFSFASLFDIWKSDRQISSGQEQKVFYSTRATHENQKHGISPSFQLKIRKILCFDFS